MGLFGKKRSDTIDFTKRADAHLHLVNKNYKFAGDAVDLRRKTPNSPNEVIDPFSEISDTQLLNALVHNWGEQLGDDIAGTRAEVLSAVMAHVVKRIETQVYCKTLEKADAEALEKLNLDEETCALLIDVLKTCVKADPLFIRFLAYSQLSGKPGEGASPVALHIPGKEKAYTIASLFPKETKFLANELARIAVAGENKWTDKQGGKIF